MCDVVMCAEVVVTNVTSLLKTVKTVEDEAARGTQALESSIEAISQEMKVWYSLNSSHCCHKLNASASTSEVLRRQRHRRSGLATLLSVGAVP